MSDRALQMDELNEVCVWDCWGGYIRPGDRVRLRGSHLNSGRFAIYEGVEYLPVLKKFAALVRFENGLGCYVTSSDQWEGARLTAGEQRNE